MGAKYLLDTNVVIDFSSEKLPVTAYKKLVSIIDNSPTISIINKIELLSLTAVPRKIVQFTNQASIIYLNDSIVTKTIDLRKKYRIKLPDAIIAAAAMVFNLTLISHNIIDFKRIKGLKIIDSHLLA